MEVWLKERILQRYVMENSKKFQPFGLKILAVRDNKDQYPDLYCTLEDRNEIPVEVEWKTSNFVRHGHDINLLKENRGCLIVCEQDQQLGFDIPQYKVDLTHFENWFNDKALQIIRDTTQPYKKTKTRTTPKLWFTYLSLKAGGVSDFDTAIQHKTWGVQKNYSSSVINKISSIQQGDIIAFIGPGKLFPGRVNLKEWMKKSFKGYFERIRLYRVTRSYFYDEETKIWQGTGKQQNETYPHRFSFDPKPILDLKHTQINRLTPISKQELHSMVYGNLIEPSPSTMIDIIHHSQ